MPAPDLDSRLSEYFSTLQVDVDHEDIRAHALGHGQRRRSRRRAAVGVLAVIAVVGLVAVALTRTPGSSDRVAASGAHQLLFDNPPTRNASIVVPASIGDLFIRVEVDQPNNMCVYLRVPDKPGESGSCFPFRTQSAIEVGGTSITDSATGAFMGSYVFGATRSEVDNVFLVTDDGGYGAPTVAVPGLDIRVYVVPLSTTAGRLHDITARGADGAAIATQQLETTSTSS